MKKFFALALIMGMFIVPSVSATGFEFKESYELKYFADRGTYENFLDIYEDGDKLYAKVGSSAGADIEVVDISDPERPMFITEIPYSSVASGTSPDYAVKDDFLYVMDGAEVIVYDVSDPTTPTEKKRVAAGVTGATVTFIEDRLYVRARTSEQISIFDISSPSDIVLLGIFYDDDETMMKGGGDV